MSTDISMHEAADASFGRSGDIRWLKIIDNRGNSICVFVSSLEQLDLMLEAIKTAVRSFEPEGV